jgi:hypothetical protein
MMKCGFAYITSILTLFAVSAGAVELFNEDFESPDVTGYQEGTAPAAWVQATAGFGGSRHGLLDQDSGSFVSPDTNNNQQVYAFRYTNSGLTTKPDRIGPLVDGITYTVSLDVVMDGSARPYTVQLIAFSDGAARWDARSTPAGSRMLRQITGNAPTNGSFASVSFNVTGDTNTHAGVLWYDLGVRFLGASTSANIDNILVANDLPPDATPPTLSPSNVVDDVGGGPVPATQPVTYTVRFSERLDLRTVSTRDFENAGTATVSIDGVTETEPGVYVVNVTPLSAGTLQLQVSVGAFLADLQGHLMVTDPATADDTVITVLSDTYAPALEDIVADRPAGTIGTNTVVNYTLTFSEAIDSNTVAVADFTNMASSDISIGTITGSAPHIYRVPVRGTTGGTMQLAVLDGSVVDLGGNALTNRASLVDDMVFTVDAVAPVLLPTNMLDSATHGVVAADVAVTYTLTFSKDMNAGSVTATDFDNAGTASIEIGAIAEPSNGVFTVVVTPRTAGSLQLRVPAGARLLDAVGNALDSSVAIVDDAVITVIAEAIPPTLISISDKRGGGPVNTNWLVRYTVTFDEEMDAATVTAADFTNVLDAPIIVATVTQTTAGVFAVDVMPTGVGRLQLAIPAGAVLADPSGNLLNTGSNLLDDTTIEVTVFRSVLFEDFESPSTPTGYSQNTLPDNGKWVGSTAGFAADRRGITDKAGGDFSAPDPNHQAFAFRYTANQGITSAAYKLGLLFTGVTYSISFDIVEDGGKTGLDDTGYDVALMTFGSGAARTAVNPIGSGGTVLKHISGDGLSNGSFETVSFTYTVDAVADADELGKDVALRFKGDSLSGIIDNVRVQDTYKPTPPVLVDMDDNVAGGPSEANQWLTYTVAFNEDMDASTVGVEDFAYTGSVWAVFGDVTETAPGVFAVEILPRTNGTLQLYIPMNALLRDVQRDVLDTSVAIFDNTNVIISADQTPPLLTQITDVAVNNEVALNRFFTYTVYFNEAMMLSSFDASDFDSVGTAPIVVGAITNLGPNVFTVDVMPTSNGTIRLQVPTNAVLLDSYGNPLDASSPILDDDILSVDTNGPTLLSVVDDRAGASIEEVNVVTYTLTFSEDIDASTLNAGDFGNASNSVLRIGTITESAPGVFTVQVTPKNVSALQLQLVPGATINDANGVAMDSAVAVVDDTTISVTPTFLPEDTILYDDFEQGLGNWSATNGAGLYTYSGSGLDYAVQGTNAADETKSGASHIILAQPLPLDSKAYTNITVEFKYIFLNPTSTRRLYLQYAADGINFSNVSGGLTFSGDVSYKLVEGAYTFTDNAKFRFVMADSGGADIRVGIDQVRISARPIWVPPPPPTAMILIVK